VGFRFEWDFVQFEGRFVDGRTAASFASALAVVVSLSGAVVAFAWAFVFLVGGVSGLDLVE
jgi:hypothetical protein